MPFRSAIPLLAAGLVFGNVSPALAADPAVTECGRAYLTLERAFAQRALRLGRLLCESPDRVDAGSARVVQRTNIQIAAFNAQYTAQQCDPDVTLPVAAKTVADVRGILEGQLRSVPLDRFCNGVADPLPLCGNGRADLGELCDGGDLADQTCQSLGNGSGTLECAADCQSFVFSGCSGPAVCGNGITEPARGEACDTAGASLTCDYDCTLPACGDGVVNANRGEQCDDGNQIVGDDCVDCRGAYCGDFWVNFAREQCDAGGGGGPDCDVDCTRPICGDGLTNRFSGEECDDGNPSDGDGCSVQCTFECASAP